MTTGNGAPIVTFDNVSKHYGALKAVDGLSLELRGGETVALLGPNGAGKSTSLDMLLALRKPTAGKITNARHAGRQEPRCPCPSAPSSASGAAWSSTGM